MSQALPTAASASPVDGLREENARQKVAFEEIEKIGPNDLAGRYLRLFWHPIMHSHELPIGRALPVRVLGESFTVYRGESGTPFVIAPYCPHRGAPMNIGRVQGDELRCFYHGWKFAGDGTCTEQPAERPSFCERVRIKAYPTREYIGLIFAYLGEGEPPEFPRYPLYESKDVVLTYDSYVRPCCFFNNLENSGDFAHIAFAHSSLDGAWDESADMPTIEAEESCWGVTMRNTFPGGRKLIYQFGMPNLFYGRVLPDDAALPYREFLVWWVPIAEDRHIQFTVTRTPRIAGFTEQYLARRTARFGGYDLDPEKVANDILAGRIDYADVDPSRVWMVVLQDHIAQKGVQSPSKRPREMLGRSDIAVIRQRRVWLRELQNFADGKPLKQWCYDAEKVPVHSEFR